MGLIDKDATLKAIADYLRADLADCNHYYLQGAQDVAEVVENMPEVIADGQSRAPEAGET